MENLNETFMLTVNGGNWTMQSKADSPSSSSSSSSDFWLSDSCRSFEFFLCSVVIGSICLIGLIGNIISFVVLGSDKQNRVATFLLQALAVADSSLLIVSVLILSAILGPFQIPSTRPTLQMIIPYMKKYINPFGMITQSITIWMTVLLAINRYIAVCKPFAAKNMLTLRKAQLQVALIVVLAVGFMIPRFFQYDVVYRLENNVTIPRKQLTALGNNVSFDIGYFNVFYNIVILVLPLVVLVLFNTKIIWDMQVSKINMRRNSLNYDGLQERNITIVMLFIILKLIIFHTPDRIVSAIKIVEVHHNPFLSCPHPVIYASHFSNLLIIINSSTDFFIYCIFRERFRRIFRVRFCCDRPDMSYSGSRRTSSALVRLPSYASAENQPTTIRKLFCRRNSSNSNDRRLLSCSRCSSNDSNRQESPPFRNGESLPLRNGESLPFRNGESLPLRNGESLPLRNGESLSLRNGESLSLRNGESLPFRNGESLPFRNGESLPFRNGESLPLRNGDAKHSSQIMLPSYEPVMPPSYERITSLSELITPP